MNRKTLYWLFQLGGWAFFILLQILFYKLSNNPVNSSAIFYFTISYILGISLTHFLRLVIIKFSWLNKNLLFQIYVVFTSSFVLALIFEFVQFSVFSLFYSLGFDRTLTEIAQNVINIGFVFLLWSLIYFSFFYFEKYRRSEIANLKFQFSMNEIELNKLKSQLNPHFMFNAMNSIRALIDEDPLRAKDAITMMSNILRNTLQMEKNKLIPFEDELKIVRDYLELEHIRFENRLSYSIQFTDESRSFHVPTMMIQTLVENGIKHGISKLVDGGNINVQAEVLSNHLIISITNPGVLDFHKSTDGGYGIKNTKQRLELLFGSSNLFEIYQSDSKVITKISLPKTQKEDSR